MGFFDDFFGGKGDKDGKKSGGGSSSNSNSGKNDANPLDRFKNQMSKLTAGQRKFHGTGQSLGGSKPGKVIPVSLTEPGPLGMKIERRPNSEGTAIVAMVVDGSQAQRAGLQRGDVICFAGSNGQEEIMYNMILELASSSQRPLEFEVRRIERISSRSTSDDSSGSKSKPSKSAEADHRKQAMIAAAEAREKAHKAKQKPVARGGLGVGVKYKTEEQKRIEAQRLEQMKAQPESAEAQRARAAAKAEEARLAAELGYNPYETSKATSGQARNATTTTQHGAIQAGDDGSGMAPIPVVAPPTEPASRETSQSSQGAVELPVEFQDAFSTMVSTNETSNVKSSLETIQKLINNAVTKGQDESDPEKASKFRRVRLSNAKVNAALVQMEGAVELMMSVGFQLHHEDGEDYLVYPPHAENVPWLQTALSQLKSYASS